MRYHRHKCFNCYILATQTKGATTVRVSQPQHITVAALHELEQ